LRRLYTALDCAALGDEPSATIDWDDAPASAFRAAMNDDFNTPGAVAVLFELAARANRGSRAAAGLLRRLGGTLGILQQAPRAFLQSGPGALDEAAIAERIAARTEAKKARDFALADRIRAELLERGIVLQDSAAGTSWIKA
ncbi:MAG TPA: DALR domain-containing protein, partial [Burkholderiaceae bacterium]